MLWWDDLLKNIPAMNSNNYTQEGQVEGQVVNDQVANDQNEGSQKGNQKKGGLGSTQSKLKDTLTVSDGEVSFRGFHYEVGTDYSTYISGKYRQGVIDDELDKINSKEDLKAFLDKQIEEKKEKDKKKKQPKNYSKKSIDQLQVILNDVLQALGEKTNKSPEVLCADAQDAWEKRELERIDKEEEEAREAKARRDARREAILSKSNNQPNQ